MLKQIEISLEQTSHDFPEENNLGDENYNDENDDFTVNDNEDSCYNTSDDELLVETAKFVPIPGLDFLEQYALESAGYIVAVVGVKRHFVCNLCRSNNGFSSQAHFLLHYMRVHLEVAKCPCGKTLYANHLTPNSTCASQYAAVAAET